jgi:hypothetical protein
MDAVFCKQQRHAAAHASAANHGNLRELAPVCSSASGLLTVVKFDMASECAILLGELSGPSGYGQREGENEDVEVGERGEGRKRGVGVVYKVIQKAEHGGGLARLFNRVYGVGIGIEDLRMTSGFNLVQWIAGSRDGVD